MATTFKKAAPKPLPLTKPVQLTATSEDDSPAGASEHVKATSTKAAPKASKAPKEYDTTTGEEMADEVEVKGTQAVAVVNKKYKDGSETDEQIPVGGIQKFKEPHATVGLSMAVTRNLGNYESVKMMVSLYMPCANNEQAMQDAFDEAKGWVDTRVELLNQEVNEQLA